MLFSEDPILRQVKKLAEALARLSGAAAGDEGVRDSPDREELEELHRNLFAMSSAMTRSLSPDSLVAMVAPHQVEAAATLLEIEAALATQQGDANGAAVREAQARRLRGGTLAG